LETIGRAADRWVSLGIPVSPTNQTDRHDITEILLKVAKDYKIGFCCLDNNHSTNFIWKKKLLNSDEEPIIIGCSVDLRGILM
jgi:hypothetical protein